MARELYSEDERAKFEAKLDLMAKLGHLESLNAGGILKDMLEYPDEFGDARKLFNEIESRIEKYRKDYGEKFVVEYEEKYKKLRQEAEES